MAIVKYLLIDGNNLGVRTSFANKELGIDMLDYSSDTFNPDEILRHDNRFPTGSLHGFFRTVASIRRLFPDRYLCVVWDGKGKQRIIASREAADRGLVPQAYKENRGNPPEQVVNFHRQKPELMAALSMTDIPQVAKPDEEADDVIASYVTALAGNDVLILTNDKDYYQLFSDGVRILDSSGTVLDETWFRRTYGISPQQWIEVGGMQGDAGDNIFGVPWWGEGTAVKEIAKHGSCAGIMAEYHKSFDHLRVKYPDVKGEHFALLKNSETADGKRKFPGVKEWMPFTGVALAYDGGAIKMPRNVVMALVYEERIALARSLKAMHRDIRLPSLPAQIERDKVADFVAFCRKYALREIEEAADVICARQPKQ